AAKNGKKAKGKAAKKDQAKDEDEEEEKDEKEEKKAAGPKKLEKIEELAGKRIAVIGRSEATRNVLELILKQYEIPLDKVQIIQPDTTDVGPAIRESKVDAVMTVGPTSSHISADAVAAAGRDREPPSFLAIDASEAIAQRFPVFEATEIPAG